MRLCFTRILWLIGVFLLFAHPSGKAQICPPNIDFENGDFSGWTCYTGKVTGNGSNVISLTAAPGPVGDQHTLYGSFPGNGLDPYGGFPINCPNGSGHSIRLGNERGGGEAEGISYEFTIPRTENLFTLIYNYAVVFQDPNHLEYQQPRMEIEITNVTDNTTIYCSSFTFISTGSSLPGFFQSPNPGSETPVWCKDWTAVSINLNGNAGKKIRLMFKTADCTFQRHFGYAYIDVNSECSGSFVGATYCPDDTLVNVVAPYGYQSYTWFNNNFTNQLGYNQILTLKPPPPPGTRVAVALEPYAGYGCRDTLYADLIDTLNYQANAGPDMISCNQTPVQIGARPRTGFTYQWSPAIGLNNANISNPFASPGTTTRYVLTVRHDGGGCVSTDTVWVQASIIDTSLQIIGKTMFCLGTGDFLRLRVNPTDSIQWFNGNNAIAGANSTELNPTQSGVYRATLYNSFGCALSTRSIVVTITSIPKAGVNAGLQNQCLIGNQFTFTNTSTNVLGDMQYVWTLGNGQTTTLQNPVFSYSEAGVYNVKLKVNSSPVCADSISFVVNVYQNAIARFTAEPVCVNLPMNIVNKTVDTMRSRVNYLWNFGNGQTSTLRNPVLPVYSVEGNYTISLSVNTEQCPNPINVFTQKIPVDRPKASIRYPLQYAVINYPVTLKARDIGSEVLWTPATWLNTTTSYTPVFKGPNDQQYTITLTTESGCVTVDTMYVKTINKADVFVPTAFTPNDDGLNDYLQPGLFGIKEVRYFRVFNRWGQVVYDSKDVLPGWDGKIAGVPQGSQAFVWMIEAIGLDNTTITKQGTSTLVR